MWTPSWTLLSLPFIKNDKSRVHKYFIPILILCFWYIFIIPWWSKMGKIMEASWTKLTVTDMKNVEIGQKNKNDNRLACTIPTLDPYNDLMVVLSEKQFKDDAGNRPPPCIHNNATKFFIDLNSNLVRTHHHSFWTYAVCYFQPYRRDPDKVDFTYIIGEVHLITKNSTKLEGEDEFVSIWCYDHRTHSNDSQHESQNFGHDPPSILPLNRSNLIYEDHLPHVPIKSFLTMADPKSSKMFKIKETNSEKMSILILGMDTLSRLNFIRSMPTVHKFLKEELSAVDFRMFNSMGWDSWDNLSILMTGHSMAELRREHCFWTNSRGHRLDECPFIWKSFAQLGYVTSYLDEDVNGPRPFRRSPSLDYDFRDFIRKWQKHNLIGHDVGDGSRVCFGSRLTYQIHLDLMYRMAHRFQSGGNFSRPYFHYSWSQLLTHDVSTMTRYGDEPLLNWLKELWRENLMDNTAIILVGDHGLRYGIPRSESAQGFFEERHPLLMIILPSKFRQKYSLAMENLRKNEHRLVTVLDVHATLRNFLNLSTLTDSEILKRGQGKEKILNEDEDLHESFANKETKKKGLSLFLPISSQRHCQHFYPQMDETYCSCLPPESSAQNPSLNDPLVLTGAQMLVKEINRRVKKKIDKMKKCPQKFTLQRITKTKIFRDFIHSSSRPRFSLTERLHLTDVENTKRHLYEIWIHTNPPPAEKYGFKAYLTHFENNNDTNTADHWDVLGLSLQFDESGHNLSRTITDGSCLKEIIDVEV